MTVKPAIPIVNEVPIGRKTMRVSAARARAFVDDQRPRFDGTSRNGDASLRHERPALPFEHGAPPRLRNEIELGFKQAKWIKGIEFVAHCSEIGGGYGGYNEDHELFG